MPILTTIPEHSREIEWNTEEPEDYSYMCVTWNVQEAKRILVKKPRKIIRVGLEGLKGWVERPKWVDGKCKMKAGHTIDWGKIDKGDVDLAIPIILADMGEGSTWPIDGWHRIAEAVEQGMANLPGVFLTKSEVKKIRYR